MSYRHLFSIKNKSLKSVCSSQLIGFGMYFRMSWPEHIRVIDGKVSVVILVIGWATSALV